MIKSAIESAVLKGIERICRKEAESCSIYPDPPIPNCPIILHQPKRPKKSNNK